MVLKYNLVVVLVFFAGFLEVSAADSLRTEKIGDRYYVIHRVEKGETLYSLSRRYNAELHQIVKINGIVNNQISLEQELQIPISRPETSVEPATAVKHTVESGETLYSISRRYGVSVDQLQVWNNLAGNEISIGQQLVVSAAARAGSESENPLPEETNELDGNPSVAESTGEVITTEEKDSKIGAKHNPEDFTVYYVQNGDLLGSIAQKFNVRPDSIVIWNDLPNTYLSIGQKLLIRGKIDAEQQRKAPKITTTSYGTLRKVTDQSGFIKIYEEGVASKIDSSVETEKYLALHRTLPMGTLIEVRNLMNNQKVFVRVVGKLPETGLNENVLIRLTPVCFERLGVIDSRARVEVSYYEE